MLQLFDRAHGDFKPIETFWCGEDGAYIDPFRPNIGQKFQSIQALNTDLSSHFTQVRKMFKELDVFIFTLGLTEAWENMIDGAVYPVAPGVISKNQDNKQYRLVNFGYQDIIRDFDAFLEKLIDVNPNARIILTVSPVPLIATKLDRHVLSSSVLSKSILCSAADKISHSYSCVDYFPSFEIITGNFNRGSYFANNSRSILEKGVDHVMRIFMENCTSSGDMYKSLCSYKADSPDAGEKNLIKVMNELSDIICDEEVSAASFTENNGNEAKVE